MAHSASEQYLFGTLETLPEHVQYEFDHGVKVAMMELRWDLYEPVEGVFDTHYIVAMKQQMERLRKTGMKVTLGLGLHYTPKWIFNYPDSEYVNQDGKHAHAMNLIFNRILRAKAERYFQSISKEMGVSGLWAIRLNSGGDAEILYPGGGDYWAFDQNAQNGINIPASMQKNPFPGWKPGDRSIKPTDVQLWADWYIRALDDVIVWQINTFKALGFTGYFQLLTPGSGSRPNGYANDIKNYLPQSITGVGAVWHKFYEFMPVKHNVVAYVSSMADLSGNDDACSNSDDSVDMKNPIAEQWSATRWISRVADNYGFVKNGENPGYNIPSRLNAHYTDLTSSGMMDASIRQMQSCGFQGMYWAHDKRLWDGTLPFSNYADYIMKFQNNPEKVGN